MPVRSMCQAERHGLFPTVTEVTGLPDRKLTMSRRHATSTARARKCIDDSRDSGHRAGALTLKVIAFE